MELHAEYFLKCSAAAKWLNTPQPITGVPKEFLDGAHATTTTIEGACKPQPSSPPPPRRPRSPKSKPFDVNSLATGFPSLEHLGSGASFGDKSLLYVPVQLHDHFVFGVVLGCPIPPPDGVPASEWTPLVTRFVLDAGRKCCLMFSYFAEGSIVVSVDCFNEVGDHFSEITFFQPTPVVGVFPSGIRGRMQVLEKRDCPKCTKACRSCSCPVNERVEAIVSLRKSRQYAPEQGPAHAGSTYKDDDVLIQTYPYWAQVLDEYKWSRVGSYCVQIQYTPIARPSCSGSTPSAVRTLAYRASVRSEYRVTVEKMLRVALFDKGVSALKPPATDVRWETSSTVSVNAKDQVFADSNPVNAVCFTDWHKLPGFQEDYLLVAPSNIVSSAHARAELARVTEERIAAENRRGMPMLPSWASGRAGVVDHILQESFIGSDGFDTTLHNSNLNHLHSQLQHMHPAMSAGTVMHGRVSLEGSIRSSEPLDEGSEAGRSSGDRERSNAERKHCSKVYSRSSVERGRSSAERARSSMDRSRSSIERVYSSIERTRTSRVSASRSTHIGRVLESSPRGSLDCCRSSIRRCQPDVVESNGRRRSRGGSPLIGLRR